MGAAAPRRERFRLPVWVIAAAGLIVGLVALLVVWEFQVAGPLASRIAAYRAAGEPTSAADLSSGNTLDPEQNAAEFLRRAHRSLKIAPEARETLGRAAQLNSGYNPERAAVVADNAEALALLRRARELPQAEWDVQLASPLMIGGLRPDHAEQRLLAKLLRVAAVEAAERGEGALALGYVRDALRVSRAIGASDPTLINHLVEVGIGASAIAPIESLGVCVDFADPNTAHEARVLLSELREEPFATALVTALTAERVSLLEMLKAPPAGTAQSARIFWPVMKIGATTVLDHSTAVRDAARATRFPLVMAETPEFPESSTPFGALASILGTRNDRAIELNFRARAQQRMAALALEIRLHEAQHDRPLAGLHELVEEFGPLPEDPFAADGRSLRLGMNGLARVLYSVGSDGVDQTGAFAITRRGTIDLEVLDLVFFLDGDRPPVPAD